MSSATLISTVHALGHWFFPVALGGGNCSCVHFTDGEADPEGCRHWLGVTQPARDSRDWNPRSRTWPGHHTAFLIPVPWERPQHGSPALPPQLGQGTKQTDARGPKERRGMKGAETQRDRNKDKNWRPVCACGWRWGDYRGPADREMQIHRKAEA